MSEEPTQSLRKPGGEARFDPRRQKVGKSLRWDAFAAVLAAILAFLTYGATLLPGAGYSGDVAKFQFVGWSLGTPHATGYPAWMLASHAFTRLLPVGSIAWRANLLSAVCSGGRLPVGAEMLGRFPPGCDGGGVAFCFRFALVVAGDCC